MRKHDWKQAMLNEAEASAEADAIWSAETKAYAVGAESRQLLAFIALLLVNKLAAPLLAFAGLTVSAPLACGPTANCVPALLGVVLLMTPYAALIGHELGRRGLGLGWVLAFFILSGDTLRLVTEAMGWNSIGGFPEAALFILAYSLPLVRAHAWGEQKSTELL